MRHLFLLLAVLGLTACVTINIYFPAAAAEKVADKIIDEVWQIEKGKDSAKKPEANGSAAETSVPAHEKELAK
ncbi:MAG TPA: hypothetical protein PLI90_03625 [Rhodocyclaceae bacterium]|nr:hypothetical protein [Rhodocyclaceae bacterium]